MGDASLRGMWFQCSGNMPSTRPRASSTCAWENVEATHSKRPSQLQPWATHSFEKLPSSSNNSSCVVATWRLYAKPNPARELCVGEERPIPDEACPAKMAFTPQSRPRKLLTRGPREHCHASCLCQRQPQEQVVVDGAGAFTRTLSFALRLFDEGGAVEHASLERREVGDDGVALCRAEPSSVIDGVVQCGGAPVVHEGATHGDA